MRGVCKYELVGLSNGLEKTEGDPKFPGIPVLGEMGDENIDRRWLMGVDGGIAGM